MKWILTGFLFVGSLFARDLIQQKKHAITYEVTGSGARLGDKALHYSQARYLSYATGLPFLWRNFPYDEQLQIQYDSFFYDAYVHRFRKKERIDSRSTFTEFLRKISDPNTPPTLFIVGWFPSDISEWPDDASRSILLNIPWGEAGFKHYLQESLVPRIEIPNLRKEGVLNVAVHVRTLSGGDTEEILYSRFPLKCTSTSYHKRQIQRVYALNLQRPMHVFLFTDAKNPQTLLREFKEAFPEKNIDFDTLPNADVDHATSDLFAMQKFDCLIATQSCYSMMAWRLGDFDLVLFPVHVEGSYPHLEVDRVQMLSKKSAWFPYDFDLILKEDL